MKHLPSEKSGTELSTSELDNVSGGIVASIAAVLALGGIAVAFGVAGVFGTTAILKSSGNLKS